jgi:hypothetical protein
MGREVGCYSRPSERTWREMRPRPNFSVSLSLYFRPRERESTSSTTPLVSLPLAAIVVHLEANRFLVHNPVGKISPLQTCSSAAYEQGHTTCVAHTTCRATSARSRVNDTYGVYYSYCTVLYLSSI